MDTLSTTVSGGATFDSTGAYRYLLWREWGPGPRVLFVMLNPSTADATADDPTLRRCIAFARSWGFASLEVVNLCAYRTPSPAILRSHPDPIGPDNPVHVASAISRASLTVAAWGNHGSRYLAGLQDSLSLIPLHALRLTATRSPSHPLYLPKIASPVPFSLP